MEITLAAARVNAGMSQKEVAKVLEVSNKTVSNWENGITQPKSYQMTQLSKLYQMPISSIIFTDKSKII